MHSSPLGLVNAIIAKFLEQTVTEISSGSRGRKEPVQLFLRRVSVLKYKFLGSRQELEGKILCFIYHRRLDWMSITSNYNEDLFASPVNITLTVRLETCI